MRVKNWKLQNGYTIFQVLGGRSNVFLIATPNGNLLVDAGVKRKRKQLLKNIGIAGINTIDWLLITHCHFDHCANAAFIKSKFNCKIACSYPAKTFAEKGDFDIPSKSLVYPSFVLKLASQFGKSIFKYDPFTSDFSVPQNQLLNLPGFDIQLISTPGHSIDSACFLVGNEILLAGDTLFGIFPNSAFPAFYNDKKTLLESWKQLLKLNVSVFLPSHGVQVSRELLKKEIASNQ